MKLRILAGVALVALAAPALADVKAGVDAWSRGDFAKAVAEWRGPATAGDADAQFNLGQAYKLGRGVPTDPVLARDWFQKAAAQGHLQAQDNLGLALFQEGRKADALPWLEKSAARDEKRTELVLGTMLFNGDGVPKDWVRAYALVTRSSQQGLPQGSQTLAQMDQYIPVDQRQRGIAMAKEIEARGRSLTADLPQPTTASATGPASTAAVPALPGAAYPAPGTRPAPATMPKQPVATRPAPPAPRPAPTPATAPVVTAARGNWRIQLGAFSSEANARAQWAKVGSRVKGSPAYVRAGNVVRLQATGYASEAAAKAACRSSGVSCLIVAP